MTLPIILCDDDIMLITHYKQIIKNLIMINDYDMELVLVTTDPHDVLLYHHKANLTNCLFFLDIDLGKNLTGIDVAQLLRKENEFAKIVFITSHQELALETLRRQIAPLDYIVKDGKTEKQQIENILKICNEQTVINHKSNLHHVSFAIGSRNFKIDLASIYFLETSVTPHKVILYGENMMYEFYGKMNELEKEYPELLRVHRSFLINTNQIRSVDFKTRRIVFPEEYTCDFSISKTKVLKMNLKS
ncbi:transcriptional regulator [Enterococcus durans]|uniref:LytR/AlgR family response regulator transcription factor n=1 Tax=Enterococcus durans TaxID=53345 RepID=UPI00069FE0DD|nr:LytTR family DNA-binding domain-containing protein [Enterococcus durans]AKX85416.1 transcriptional regulator [Enterococcus durans]AKZ49076.1 transcriptional regulator [Enterococcus durans]NEX85219.1 response regulator transcription factor [Enterococcus durans]RXE80827.1 DNA-binding response regulator [Enterococcus durans]